MLDSDVICDVIGHWPSLLRAGQANTMTEMASVTAFRKHMDALYLCGYIIMTPFEEAGLYCFAHVG